VVPFEKRFTTALTAAALLSGARGKIAAASAPRAMISRKDVIRARQSAHVKPVNSLQAGEASTCLDLRRLMGSAGAFTVLDLGRNAGDFGSPAAAYAKTYYQH